MEESVINEREVADISVMYHYCSISTFYNVIKNKSIWLSDISKSNDSQELRWFLDEIEVLLHSTWDLLIKERKEAGFHDDPTEVYNLYSRIRRELSIESVKTWAFCLSEKKDDLGQWRGYADNGKGLAIGFNVQHFHAVNFFSLMKLGSKGCTGLDSLLSPRFEKVNYGKTGISNYVERIRTGLGLSAEMPPSIIYERLLSIIPTARKLAPFYKNEGFSEEAEWRLVYTHECDDMKQENFREISAKGVAGKWGLFLPAKWGYIEKDGDLVSHIEFQNNRFIDSISEIIIGPKCKLTENELKLFFVSCGLFPDLNSCTVKISKSASSYQ